MGRLPLPSSPSEELLRDANGLTDPVGLRLDSIVRADTLDWLTDTGDLHESYQPTQPEVGAPRIPEVEEKAARSLAHAPSVNNMSLNTLPRIDSAVDVVVPPLPSLFDGASEAEDQNKKLASSTLVESVSTATIDEHLQVFDSPLEEHDFVSTILENTGESSGSLPVLG